MKGVQDRLIAVLVVGVFFFAETLVAAATSSAEMQEALESHRCPANATEVNTLTYDSCGPQGSRPDEVSASYLRCQKEIDAENNRIAAYNDFIRSCPPPPKISITQIPIDRFNALKLVEPYAHAYPPLECHRQNGLMVCTSSKEYTNAFKDLYRGQCLDIRSPTGGNGARICHQSSDYFFDQRSHPNYTYDFCVDVICIPKDTRPYY